MLFVKAMPMASSPIAIKIILTHPTSFVFGYGSLVNVDNLEQYLQRKLRLNFDYTICSLKGWRRCWNVAMDNNIDLPKYKYYCDRETKRRLNCYVTFLNIRPDFKQIISGILFRVSDKELKNLDLRERNYRRVNITQQLNVPIQGNVWTYIGLPEAEQRYQKGLMQNKAVISQDYFDLVRNAYRSLGSEEFVNYVASTEQPIIPIVELEKHMLR